MRASLPVLPSSTPEAPRPKVVGARSVFIETIGCQMNEHDSLRMGELLAAKGFCRVDSAAEADLVLINTCSVREHSVQKALSHLGRYREQKKEGRAVRLGVTGCVAQQEGDKLLKKYKELDLVLGPDNIYQLPAAVDRLFGGERLALAELDESPGFQFLGAARGASPVSAFVTVQKGCDKRCSYCIVPRVRGQEVSRPLEAIVDEVRALVASGTREVTLLGQNIDAFRDPKNLRLDGLLRAVAAVPGLSRLRFTTSHPNDFSEPMAQAMADAPVLCEHLHLPAQSGSDAVLKRMYRGYSRSRYLEKIAMMREKLPDVGLTSDLIVGFPGESEEDFEATLSLVSRADFDAAYCYTYSVRPGTPAEPWEETVSEADKRRRLQTLNLEIERVARRRLGRFVGRVMEVLVEGPSRTDASMLTGRLRHNTPIHFAGDHAPGAMVQVEVLALVNGFSLRGRVAPADAPR